MTDINLMDITWAIQFVILSKISGPWVRILARDGMVIWPYSERIRSTSVFLGCWEYGRLILPIFLLGPKLGSGNRWAWRLLETAAIWTKWFTFEDYGIMPHARDEVESHSGWTIYLRAAWDLVLPQTVILRRVDNQWKGDTCTPGTYDAHVRMQQLRLQGRTAAWQGLFLLPCYNRRKASPGNKEGKAKKNASVFT